MRYLRAPRPDLPIPGGRQRDVLHCATHHGPGTARQPLRIGHPGAGLPTELRAVSDKPADHRRTEFEPNGHAVRRSSHLRTDCAPEPRPKLRPDAHADWPAITSAVRPTVRNTDPSPVRIAHAGTVSQSVPCADLVHADTVTGLLDPISRPKPYANNRRAYLDADDATTHKCPELLVAECDAVSDAHDHQAHPIAVASPIVDPIAVADCRAYVSIAVHLAQLLGQPPLPSRTVLRAAPALRRPLPSLLCRCATGADLRQLPC